MSFCSTFLRGSSSSRITLADNPPDDPEGSFMLPTLSGHSLYNASTLLKDHLNLINSFAGSASGAHASVSANASAATTKTAASDLGHAFSISDFLVPALQTKVWDDWQAADDFTALDLQTFPFDVSPLHGFMDGLIGNTHLDWEHSGLSADQAYDEFVFDLTPSAFDSNPTTVNVADLIVGPHSLTASPESGAISPRDLELDIRQSTYEDLALANLYGFTEGSSAFDSSLESCSDSGSDSDGSLGESNSESEVISDDEDEVIKETKKAAVVMTETPIVNAIVTAATPSSELTARVMIASDAPSISLPAADENHRQLQLQQLQQSEKMRPEDPNKRRMEEVLAARISNDLGPEHMSGLFLILKGGASSDSAQQDQDDEDEEMEVDLSCLDETTLVEVYQYVEACCMQTMGSILAAERASELVALAAAAESARMEAVAKRQQRRRRYSTERTPELSYASSSSSSSSSPAHPSSQPASPSSKSRRRRSHSTVGNRKRSTGRDSVPTTATIIAAAMVDSEHDALYNSTAAAGVPLHHPYKTSRKRSNATTSRRAQKDVSVNVQMQIQQHPEMPMIHMESVAPIESALILRATDQEKDLGEDTEIDIVGI
ncbi:hypothetical protein EDD11_010316 [Mortierella claussenii]|nr:hypothetical protein EDD11_010316 [Mortierella claussenii]